ncbi:MAG: S-layer homology domain-containing protein [Bacillota bacterium]|nr:S-layer homology domain-containing protein [Bacillota bacterium]
MKLRKPVSIIIVIAMLFVFPVAANDEAQSKVLSFYNGQSTLTSWWDVVALWGANSDLTKYTTPDFSDDLNDKSSVTDYAGVIFALIAMGENVHDIGGRDIASELALKQNTETGSFGDYANMQTYAILALDAAKEKYDRDKAINYLISLEAKDGGFGYTSTSSDVDLTSIVLITLSDENCSDVLGKGVDYLASQQLEDGGFSSWGTENSNTLEAVISALAQLGSLNDERFIKNDETLADVLQTYQLDDGSFVWGKGEKESNMMATQQGLIALSDINASGSVFKRLSSKYECTPEITVNANVRIEGADHNILDDEVQITSKKPTALEAIKAALDENNIKYTIDDSSYGAYIKSIGGEDSAMFGGYDGWLFAINEAPAASSADKTTISDGDDILLYYGMFAPDTLIPTYTISSENLKTNKTFTISVKSEYYDYTTKKTVSVNVEGAKVEVGDDKFTTDENGDADIKIGKAGTYTVKIYKDNEGSYPSIVRIKPFDIKIERSPSGGGGSSSSKKPVGITVTETKEETAQTSQTQQQVTQEESTMPANNNKDVKTETANYEITYQDKADISSWAYESVNVVSMLGVFSGNENDCFKPKDNITRAELASVILKALGATPKKEKSTFEDVPEDAWYSGAVATAFEMGIIKGTGENSFAPSEFLTREQLAVIIARTYHLENAECSYVDNSDISDWAKDAVGSVTKANIMVGTDNCFNPKGVVTREMCALVIARLMGAK